MIGYGLVLRAAGGRLLALLRLVPPVVWLILALLAWGGWQRHRVATVAAQFQAAKDKAAAERQHQLEQSIHKAQAVQAAQDEAIRHANDSTTASNTAAAAAADAARRLRDQLAAERSRARAADPAAAASSPADRTADVLAACVDRYRDVAAAADRAVIAGQACERAYGALSEGDK